MVDKSTLEPCLKDISFPADSETIIECAEGNLCPREVLTEVARVPSRTFSTEHELLCSLGNPEYCSAS
jgi:hypothetical protein